MSTESPRSPEESRAAEAVRSLGRPGMDPARRERLRAEFASGTIAAPAPRGRVVPFRRGPILAALGLAAAAALALVFWWGDDTPHWRFLEARGDSGTVLVCGKVMDPADPRAIDDMLHAGTPVQTTGEMVVDLVLESRLAVQLAPGSEVTVPRWPGARAGDEPDCRVMQGEVRFTTGPEFSGGRMRVGAPLSTIEVTGTTFAVITAAESTCVCVLDGEVRMQDADGSTNTVAAGTRRSVFRSAPSRTEEILPMERMKLEMLRDRPIRR